MKSFAVACFVAFVAVANAGMDADTKQKTLELMTEIATTCAKKEGASPADLDNLMARKPPMTREGKCLLACFNEQLSVQTPEGKMDLDGAMATIEMFKEPAPQVYEAMAAIFKKCFPETASLTDRCDIAGKFADCGVATAKELGIEDSVV